MRGKYEPFINFYSNNCLTINEVQYKINIIVLFNIYNILAISTYVRANIIYKKMYAHFAVYILLARIKPM